MFNRIIRMGALGALLSLLSFGVLLAQDATVQPEPTVTLADMAGDAAATAQADMMDAATPAATSQADMMDAATPAAGAPAPNTVTGNAFVTETRPFSEEMLDLLTLPPGFTIRVAARDLENARMIVVSDAGVVYISRPMQGDVIALYDEDSDGTFADEPFRTVATEISFAHGLAIQDGRLYIAGERQVLAAEILEDGSLAPTELITGDLPDGGQHGRRTIAFGPDGRLYMQIGSSCNACLETNPEHATISVIPLDASPRERFVQGARNMLGFDWHPVTGAMWGFDQGADWRGDDAPPEELNLIEAGEHLGWPFCYGEQQVDPYIPYSADMVTDMTTEAFCAESVAPALTYTAHSSPIAFTFYEGAQFPDEYVNDGFVVWRGSWNRYPATGYKVDRVVFDENGQPTGFSDFLSGFLIEDGAAHFGRPAGLAVDLDGSLLLTDDTNGVLYRISYDGA